MGYGFFFTRRQVFKVVIITVCLQASVFATSGWDRYTLEISGGYQLEGAHGMIGRLSQGDKVIIGWGEPEYLPILGIADSERYLFLCSATGVDLTRQKINWQATYPFPDAKIIVLEKKTATLVGPLDQVGLGDYCNRVGITLNSWTSCEELGNNATESKGLWALFLGIVMSGYMPVAIGVVLFLFIAWVCHLSRRAKCRGNKNLALDP